MSIRDRINQFTSLITRQIRVSRGGVLLGRETGAGEAQEIIIGSGLTLSGGTLTSAGTSVTVVDAVADGNANAVSSNAVFDSINALSGAGDPNKARMVVSGAGDTHANGTYFENGIGPYGKAAWRNAGCDIFYQTDRWLIKEYVAGVSGGSDGLYDAVSVADYPDGLTFTLNDGASPAPSTVTAAATPGTYKGQQYRADSGEWYRWNGTAWEEDAAGGPTITVATAVADGNANPVSSNAVFDAINALSGAGVPSGTPNFFETSFTGNNNDLRFEQVGADTTPPTVSFFRSVLPPAVSVFERAVSIQFSSSQTASEIKAMVDASVDAVALVRTSLKTGNDGSGTNAGVTGSVLSATSLSGGNTFIPEPTYVGQQYRKDSGEWYRWNGTAWEEDAGGSTVDSAAIATALGIPTHADLTAANAALTIGQPYYDTALSKLQITTA